DILHKPQQCQAAFCVAIDDVREGWVFTEEETEVVATDATVSVFTVGIGPGPFVVKAQAVAVVVQRLAEVADGKVDVGFDEFLGEAGHWGDRIVTEITKSCRCRSRRSSVGLTERSGQYLLGVVPIKLLSAR